MSFENRLRRFEQRPRCGSAPEPLGPSIQKKLGLPLPAERTEEEFNETLRLLRAAIARLRADRTDTGGLDALRAFAAECHARHGGRTR